MRVLIGDDEALLREGLTLVLERGGFEVVGCAGDADELVREASTCSPDLVIADIRMPPRHADDGLLAALRIREQRPGVALLVLSQHVQRRYATDLLEHGSERVGYLLKQRIADSESFLQDVRRVCAGGSVLDPEIVSVMVSRSRRTDDAVDELTPRQREVLALMAEGRSNAAIGKRLSISEKAVVRHVSHVYDVLGLTPSLDDHRRVIAVVEYLSRRAS